VLYESVMSAPQTVADESIGEFLESLAGSEATPGGGSVTALVGAMAAALASMVCGLSAGRAGTPAARAELQSTLARAQALRRRLCAMVDEDMAAFQAVMRAYALPKAAEAERATRSAAIQAALQEATLAPLACARACAEVLQLARIAAEKGHPNAAGEAGVAVLTAQAALRCAALNVRINAGSIRDTAFVQRTLGELEQIVRSCGGTEAGA
jgi:formiminotetrahydrofolate cyclodeaminase